MPLPTCCVCGAPAFAIAPGSEPQQAPASTAHFLHALRFGARPIGWCLQHWPWLCQAEEPLPTPEGQHPNG